MHTLAEDFILELFVGSNSYCVYVFGGGAGGGWDPLPCG